jgi:hypothetical protein
MRGVAAAITATVVTLAVAAVAVAGWQSAATGAGYSRASALPAGNTPAATVSGREVTVSWSASAGGAPVAGYVVARYNPSSQAAAIGAACSGTISATTCTESAVPPGQWHYTVTPAQSNWRGAESAQSAAATVGVPALSLSPATVNAVPATVTGQITSFLKTQTVTFRLDNSVSGTLLTGSIIPSPVPTNGTASASVTLPAGTAEGAHTVYAIGSLGDVASAPVAVDTSCSQPGPQTIAASRDSYVDSLAGGSNFGTSVQLLARSAQVFVLSQLRTVVGFNLPAVPARCTLTGADLRLYATNPASGRTIQALRLNGTWTETGVTNSNLPSTTGSAVASTSLSNPAFQEWGVLTAVQAMYAGTNNGFLIKDSVDSAVLSVQQVFQSRNGTPDGQDPQLVLTFG